ncbi:MAG: hypothetical protein M1522_08130 [Actinobacteria bacterium]|nr:hypothetical protein [Actinomycetota bacterium]
MKFEDLRVGMEVLVLRSGKRSDLANARVQAAMVLSTERWTKSQTTGWSMANRSLVGPDGNKIAIHGRVASDGKCVPVLMQSNYAMLVMPSRLLGPADEWQPKIDATQGERDRQEAARLADRRIVQNHCADLHQRLEAAGIIAGVMAPNGASGSVQVTLRDMEEADRLVAMVEAGSTREYEA